MLKKAMIGACMASWETIGCEIDANPRMRFRGITFWLATWQAHFMSSARPSDRRPAKYLARKGSFTIYN